MFELVPRLRENFSCHDLLYSVCPQYFLQVPQMHFNVFVHIITYILSLVMLGDDFLQKLDPR
jgi:hypothetical protein